MSDDLDVRRELVTLSRMATPVVLSQLGNMAMGVVDTIMVGHLDDPTALPSVALGDLWIFGTLIVGIGVMMGLDPIVSQAHGARQGHLAGRALQQGIVLALLMSVPLMFLWTFTEPILLLVGQDSRLSQQAQVYVNAQLFSAAPFLVFVALRQYLQGRTLMAVTLWVTLLANLVNVFFNWVLIYGHLGFPRLEILGAGIATGVTRVFLMTALLGWVLGFRLHRGAWVPWSRESLRLSGFLRILHHGVPVGIQFALEMWAFQIAVLFAGRLGMSLGDPEGTVVASHTVALKIASVSFMVPFGISIASATRVGNLLGSGYRAPAQRAAWVSLAMGGAVMLVAAIVFVLGRHVLPRIFTADPTVVALSASVLPVAAAFQLFDGVQAVGGGILRGMGNTRPAAIFNLIGFYFLALPLAAWLTFERGHGLHGIWWGLCAGLGVVSISLVAWIAWRGPGHRPSETPAVRD